MRLAEFCSRGWPVWLFILVFWSASGSMAHELMAPADEAKRPNPVASDKQSIERGQIIYLDNCTACHGEKIEGMKAEETGLTMDSPNLKKRLLTHTDGDFFWKIQNGRGDMPSFKEDLTEEQTWDVINFIRSETE